jgi:hypothetical protein
MKRFYAGDLIQGFSFAPANLKMDRIASETGTPDEHTNSVFVLCYRFAACFLERRQILFITRRGQTALGHARPRVVRTGCVHAKTINTHYLPVAPDHIAQMLKCASMYLEIRNRFAVSRRPGKISQETNQAPATKSTPMNE